MAHSTKNKQKLLINLTGYLTAQELLLASFDNVLRIANTNATNDVELHQIEISKIEFNKAYKLIFKEKTP